MTTRAQRAVLRANAGGEGAGPDLLKGTIPGRDVGVLVRMYMYMWVDVGVLVHTYIHTYMWVDVGVLVHPHVCMYHTYIHVAS